MRRCLKCASENPDEMQFCLNCGSPLPPPVYGQQPGMSGQNLVAPVKKDSSVKLLLIVAVSIVGFFVLAGAGLVALVWMAGSNNPQPVVKNSNTKIVTPNNKNVNSNNKPRPQASPQQQGAADDTTSSRDGGESGRSSSESGSNSYEDDSALPPTPRGSFTVAANKGWQVSNIRVVPLETFNTKVSGAVSLAELKNNVTAKGISDTRAKSRRLYPEYPTGALLMRTRYANGQYSNISYVMSSKATGIWQNHPDERGLLEFAVNDNEPEENSGEFTIEVTLINVP